MKDIEESVVNKLGTFDINFLVHMNVTSRDVVVHWFIAIRSYIESFFNLSTVYYIHILFVEENDEFEFLGCYCIVDWCQIVLF